MTFEIIVPGRFIDTSDAIPLRGGLQGRFTISSIKNGVVTRTLSFNNLILNQGLDRFGTVAATSLYRYIYLGTGSTPPSPTDTELSQIVPGSGSIQANPQAFAGVGPDYVNYIRCEGVSTVGQFGTNNLAEIGIGGNSPNTLFSKALIVDSFGNPSAFPIQSDEQLAVSYELRMSPPLDDEQYIVDVSGTRNVTVRPIGVHRTSQSATFGGWALETGNNVNAVSSPGAFYTGGLNGYAENSPLGSVVSGSGSISQGGYVAGSYKRGMRQNFGSSQAVSDSLRTHLCRVNFGCFQVEYDPPLQKTDQQSMYLDYEFSWARI